MCVCVLSRFSHVRLFATLGTVVHQAPLSVGFSRREFWSGLIFQGIFLAQGLNPVSPVAPALQVDFFFFFFTAETLGKPPRCYLPFLLFFLHKCAVEFFQRLYDMKETWQNVKQLQLFHYLFFALENMVIIHNMLFMLTRNRFTT